MKNPIIVITGPTASGKTRLSFSLAKKFSGEIVCADSMTVYKGMDIGTDKPTLDKDSYKEAEHWFIYDIPHHMLDIIEPNEEFNAAIFKDIAGWEVDEIHRRENTAFLVGGSVMYIDAFIYNFQMPSVKPDQKLREKLEKEDVAKLFEKLVELDPDAEWTVDRNNKRRVIRALEIVLATKKPLATQKSKSTLPKNVLYLAVSKDREKLYEDINQRVDEMVKSGFEKEVRELLKKYDHKTAMQAAGYKQFVDFIEGKCSLPDAIEKTKQIHRNFAKRQLTWLRKNKDVIWIKDIKDAESQVQQFLSRRN